MTVIETRSLVTALLNRVQARIDRNTTNRGSWQLMATDLETAAKLVREKLAQTQTGPVE